MDFNAPMPEQAKTLLKKLVEVGEWAKNGDARAKPYLDAGAVRIVNGEPEFHESFVGVYAVELAKERRYEN